MLSQIKSITWECENGHRTITSDIQVYSDYCGACCLSLMCPECVNEDRQWVDLTKFIPGG